MDPDLYGQYTGVGIFLGYVVMSHGGIISGLRREIPFELGRQNDTHARALASSVFCFVAMIGTIAFTIYVTAGIYYLYWGQSLLALIFFRIQ